MECLLAEDPDECLEGPPEEKPEERLDELDGRLEERLEELDERLEELLEEERDEWLEEERLLGIMSVSFLFH